MDTDLERRTNESRWEIDCVCAGLFAFTMCYKYNPATVKMTKYTLIAERAYVCVPLICVYQCFNGGGDGEVLLLRDFPIEGADLAKKGTTCCFPLLFTHKDICTITPVYCSHTHYRCCLGVVPWKKKGREVYFPLCCCFNRTSKQEGMYRIEKTSVCGVEVSESVTKCAPARQTMD